ncbi:PRC-barrel domain-containing protein [Hymenobacter daecheongensis DSM 21074]|uniref:PRC-barrel domain-containing protein n=1 Tax=Hymenobacter daecheongensis DSM 21074 TaxID=1121955 RepID=A0A1M6A309_9BACT|nr:PRC-barrel domain-containing protein [Hymenobacter daecheongensis]SHI30845.1 PRC-barrel domain-containing protein [Hymenobacter daecheongensis DSM 21074]
MENTTIPSADGMHLRRLRDLTEFEVADGNPDVRGWSVRGGDGKKFGEVFELIVDSQALKVRYLDIELDAALQINEHERHILLPIGVAALDEDGDNVFVTSLTQESVLEYPPYVEIQITREYEEAMLRSLKLPLPAAGPGSFYDQDSYNDQRFYQRRRLGEGS